ncbi:hypothetical protein [Mucilaginibacter phyllosphaerae]
MEIILIIVAMFRGFQLQLDALDLSEDLEEGQSIYEAFKQTIRPILDEYLLPSGALDGTKLQADWFPNAEMDVFISHSHADKELAMRFAGWLHTKFEIVAFIDSCIWGHSDDLLEKIDKEYCWNNSTETYNYQKRNQSTTHVHLMLNTAIAKMIDHCECVFFLRTPQSTIKHIVEDKTGSPWIYSELSQTQIVRKRIPKRTSANQLLEHFSTGHVMNEQQKKELKVEYFLELNHLPVLSDDELKKWERYWSYLNRPRVGHPLDKLYEIKPMKTRKPHV